MAQEKIQFEPEEESIDFEPIDFEPETTNIDENKFQQWYKERASKLGLDPNPDSPEHFYDYRAAYKAGAEPDSSGHWPSEFKKEGHPNLIVGGINTKTGKPEFETRTDERGNIFSVPKGAPPEYRPGERKDRRMFEFKLPEAETYWGGFAKGALEYIGELLAEPESVLTPGLVKGITGGITGIRGKLPEIGKRVVGEIPTPTEIPSLKIQTKPTSVSLKQPTPALVEKLKKDGYVPAGVDSNGYPRMVLKNEPMAVTPTPETAPGYKPRIKSVTEIDGTNRIWIDDVEYTNLWGKGGPTDIEIRQINNIARDPSSYRRLIELKNKQKQTAPDIQTPFNEEIKIQNPGAAAIQRLKKKGYELDTVDETGQATFKLFQTSSENIATPEKASTMRELWNFPRGMTTTLDISAPMRQGLPLITRKEWWTSWDDMARAWGSEKAYRNIIDEIEAKPIFQKRVDTTTGKISPSFAEESGLKLTDLKTLSGREENLMSTWAEKFPGVKRSNRAYTAFLNKLRADTFESLVKEAKASGRNPYTDMPLAKEIAEFVNTATGRGKLSAQLPTVGKGSKITILGQEITLPMKERSLERHAELLTNMLFSPRLVASRIRMLNPGTYIMADPFVRKQYLKALISSAGAWGTMAGLAKIAGADVSLDPNSADFGKIKIGNTRIDPAGGFQQYLVAASKLISGKTVSTTTGREFELGQGYRAPTGKNILEGFAVNKLHPILKFAYDLVDASKYKPFHLADRTIQLFVPLIVQDAIELSREDLSLLPWLIPVSTGMGTQTYEKGKPESIFVPEEMDVTLQGSSF